MHPSVGCGSIWLQHRPATWYDLHLLCAAHRTCSRPHIHAPYLRCPRRPCCRGGRTTTLCTARVWRRPPSTPAWRGTGSPGDRTTIQRLVCSSSRLNMCFIRSTHAVTRRHIPILHRVKIHREPTTGRVYLPSGCICGWVRVVQRGMCVAIP